jgi:hypothetical protein
MSSSDIMSTLSFAVFSIGQPHLLLGGPRICREELSDRPLDRQSIKGSLTPINAYKQRQIEKGSRKRGCGMLAGQRTGVTGTLGHIHRE